MYAGSIAKQVTAACAAELVVGGALDLEAPIRTWLKDLPEWAAQIRVRHLLHHTAGLPADNVIQAKSRDAGKSHRTSAAILSSLSQQSKHQAQPGSTFAYSNCGYVCLAHIIEQVSSLTLADFAEAHFFAPFGMRQTQFWSGPGAKPPSAVALEESLTVAPLSLGDGGLWTSVQDLLRWNGGIFASRSQLTNLMHSPGALNNGRLLDYAWGIRVFEQQGYQIHSHGGSWPGATAKVIRVPQLRLSIAALALDGDVDSMVRLTNLVLERLLEERR